MDKDISGQNMKSFSGRYLFDQVSLNLPVDLVAHICISNRGLDYRIGDLGKSIVSEFMMSERPWKLKCGLVFLANEK